MKKISAILVVVLLLAMTVVPVSAAWDPVTGINLTTGSATVAVGDEFVVNVNYGPTTTTMLGTTIWVKYDTTKVELADQEGLGAVTFNTKTAGTVKIVCAADGDNPFVDGEIAALTFTAIADGEAKFTITMKDGITGPDALNDWVEDSDLTLTDLTVTVGGGSDPEPDPAFTVDKAVVDGVVKVTVANADLAGAGKIYVATFNGGVLVDCIEKTIANGTLDFTGLEGDVNTAQMFVWDNNMVPITYAISAQ